MIPLRFFKKDMVREVAGWVEEGLITQKQGESILARYGSTFADSDSNALGYYVLSALAALFIGLAIILVISHNWDEIPRMARMLSLMTLTLALNLQGARLLLKNRYRAGVLWLFLGSLSYGASIMLIAQIYHLGEHYPDGIFYWAAGVLPLVVVTRSRLLAMLTLVLATTWMIVEAKAHFFPATYPLFALVALGVAIGVKHSAMLFLGGLAGLLMWFNYLSAWLIGDGYHMDAFIDQIPINLSLGLVLLGFAWWLMGQPRGPMKNYGQRLHVWLLRFGIVLLLIASFESVWSGLMSESYLLGPYIVVPLVVGGAVGLWLARGSGKTAMVPLVINTVLFATAFWLLEQGLIEARWLAIGTNFLLLITGTLLIRQGIDTDTTQLFYMGVGTLLLTAFLRYIDLIGSYLGGALLFLLAAAVLIGAAKYWRRRHLRQRKAAPDQNAEAASNG